MRIKRISLLALCLLAVSMNAMAHDLVITNANIINPDKKIVARKGNIVIHNDRILKVDYSQGEIPSNAVIFNAKGKYVIPGLIDSHNHVDTVLGLNEEQYYSHPDLVAEYRKQLPRSYLYFGYTTVIDLVSSDQNAIHSFTASSVHPDLYTCGGGIMIANGYPMSEFPQPVRYAMFPNYVYEPSQTTSLPKDTDIKIHTPEAIIKRIVKSRAVCVKIFYEPGFGADKNLPLPALATVKKIIQLAHQRHLPVLMHANSYQAQEFALSSGADIFAHGLWNWGKFDKLSVLPLKIQHLLGDIVDQHLGYQPTMQVVKGLSALIDPQFLDNPELSHVVPRSLLSWYRTREGQWYEELLFGKFPKSLIERRLKLKESQLKLVVDYLRKSHANLLFGTDTPSGPTYGNPPGYNGYMEMRDWYDANVPLSEILLAATMRNAKFFHLDKDYGSISPGKFANLVILKKNPLHDINAYNSIASVVIHGQIYKRSEFSANKVYSINAKT